jgi:hypothetical protein
LLSRLLNDDYLLRLFRQDLSLLLSGELGRLGNDVVWHFRVLCFFKSDQVELLSASFGRSPGVLALFRVRLNVLVLNAPKAVLVDFPIGERLVFVFVP